MKSYPSKNITNDFQHEARILNAIWLITAVGLAATAGLAWIANYLEITTTKYDSPPMYVAIGLLLLCMYGLSKDINKINAAIAGVIYLFLISLVSIVVASLVPVPTIILVFSTAGAMFLISMLVGLLFKFDPGSHRFIIMMTLSGLALVIIVNATLMSERPIWVISCLMIVLWSGILSCARNKLLELAIKCHSEELWSPVRCAFTGALTLYYYFIGFFGILAAIAITLVWQRHSRFPW
ncbi:Bax inhibitor-1/YccA family protein [Escherichia albertii]|uniref:Bax inhibitor-1/YccA family protein n=1 Tax=Escherichia albertii TaxID=208962 RepID=UPI00175DAB9A|nr:Bax inhibitor-1/YccA family protein [Escherichia albertii]MDD9752912.1 Bax inhibitor-1/YccA family protein [Escherichia albertii]